MSPEITRRDFLKAAPLAVCALTQIARDETISHSESIGFGDEKRKNTDLCTKT